MTRTFALRPLLMVSDLDRSLGFYREQLGFAVVEEARAGGRLSWCRLELSGSSLMLQQAEPEDGSALWRGRGVTFYWVVDDLDALLGDFTHRGLVLSPPVTTYYGMRQLPLVDPDGYQFVFQQPVAESSHKVG